MLKFVAAILAMSARAQSPTLAPSTTLRTFLPGSAIGSPGPTFPTTTSTLGATGLVTTTTLWGPSTLPTRPLLSTLRPGDPLTRAIGLQKRPHAAHAAAEAEDTGVFLDPGPLNCCDSGCW
eukprot:Protomagalhaensia_wolfi_Nauph_80__1442@NODE_186_length_3249_cov_301_532710_g140_i0_p5_GENE_NODE_186_length_3249_cov_301_532710_g140_i0NODE_186_length_3249_cov_301_532710_g140_i0_p5_ORF_typecomplete_len121_score11_83_NODE_186_length_3249_cov_301_532710_g140_i017172079